MSKEIIKEDAIQDTDDNILVTLINTIGAWFADHPQASEDCRNYIENHLDVFDKELLDNVFGEKESDEYPEDDLPKEIIIDSSEVEVDNWGDEDAVGEVLSDYLSDVYGYCHKGFDWELDTMDSGDVRQIIITNIEWDTEE